MVQQANEWKSVEGLPLREGREMDSQERAIFEASHITKWGYMS